MALSVFVFVDYNSRERRVIFFLFKLIVYLSFFVLCLIVLSIVFFQLTFIGFFFDC